MRASWTFNHFEQHASTKRLERNILNVYTCMYNFHKWQLESSDSARRPTLHVAAAWTRQRPEQTPQIKRNNNDFHVFTSVQEDSINVRYSYLYSRNLLYREEFRFILYMIWRAGAPYLRLLYIFIYRKHEWYTVYRVEMLRSYFNTAPVSGFRFQSYLGFYEGTLIRWQLSC